MQDRSLPFAQTVATPGSQRAEARGRVVPRERVQAALEAQKLRDAAYADARAIRERARAERDEIAAAARAEGLQQGASELAAAWLRLQAKQAQADHDTLERAIELARILAERVIGETLQADPTKIVALARGAMRQLWRARQVQVHAHPEDAHVLEQHVRGLGLPPERVAVVPDASRERGSLRFVSDLGELDGALSPQLDRLATVIHRELLGS